MEKYIDIKFHNEKFLSECVIVLPVIYINLTFIKYI